VLARLSLLVGTVAAVVHMSLTIGIDPGLTGAVAVLSPDGSPELVADLPIIRDAKLAWVDGSELQSMLMLALRGRQATAIIERVSSMPAQGIASAFQFGVGFGSVLSVIQALHLRLELVTPGVWKRSLGLSKDKHASLHKARLLYPTADLRLAKHDGRAEALLIAHYGLTRPERAVA
jgi:crossover junction endodeoxyribonuclease RuvC